jgi:hypothetical protein
MSIDGTSNRTTDDETPASTRENGDRRAEQAGGQQAVPDDDRGHRRAETRTREEYADTVRASGAPIRQESSDGSRSDGRASTEEADRDAPGPHDRERESDHAAGLDSETDHGGPVAAEPRAREEYADAIRGNGLDGDHQEGSPDTGAEQDRDASEATTAVTHFRSEFKDRPLDLYTDGTRWAAAETPRTRETVSEKGDIPGQLPTGEELVDSAGENSSLLERLRHGVYEESDNETNVLEKEANLAHDVFSHPPTSSYEGTPASRISMRHSIPE